MRARRDFSPLNTTEVARHIALVGLGGFEHAYPYQLSGGMAQRAALARGLVTRPDILLLDEPFGALDALTRLRLQDELLHICSTQRTSVILVTHDVEEAIYLGDKVILMLPNPGRIARQIEIDLPGQRDRTSPAFNAQRHEIVYDLDRLDRQDDIALRGAPGRGLVTADGAWLFLPIPEPGVIQVVDARLRRSGASIEVDGAPIAIALAANFGFCH